MVDHRAERRVVLGMLLVLLLAGPLGVVDLTSPREPALGDGTATVEITSDLDSGFVIDAGRFGTGVSYLRVPALEAQLEDVTGTPRLVYEVGVPALEYEGVRKRVLSGDGGRRVRLELADRAFPREQISRASYQGRVIVRVQSFAGGRTVLNRSVTVAVEP